MRDVEITRCKQVWSTDITYLPLRRGFMYLAAVLDWHSRFVLSWELSNSLETMFCLTALEAALQRGQPDIFNTDQGALFTSAAFTSRLAAQQIAIISEALSRVRNVCDTPRLTACLGHLSRPRSLIPGFRSDVTRTAWCRLLLIGARVEVALRRLCFPNR